MLNKAFKTIDKTFGFVEDWSLFVTVSIALVVAVTNIALRKFTSLNLYWSDEVVRKVVYFTTYIGCSAAIRSRALIRIDALPQIFPVFTKLTTVISHISMLFFGALMVWLGGQLTYEMYLDEYARTVTLEIREWYFYAVLPIFGAMSFFRTLIIMIEDWRGRAGDAS